MKAKAPATKKKIKAPPKVKRENPDAWHAKFLDLLAKGLSVSDISKMEDMPHTPTIYAHIRKNKELEEAYKLAREVQAELMLDELIAIADDGRNDYMEKLDEEGQVAGFSLNGEFVQRSRLRIDTRKWIMARMAPRRYSERVVQELVGKDDGPIQTQSSMTLNQFYDEFGTEPTKPK